MKKSRNQNLKVQKVRKANIRAVFGIKDMSAVTVHAQFLF